VRFRLAVWHSGRWLAGGLHYVPDSSPDLLSSQDPSALKLLHILLVWFNQLNLSLKACYIVGNNIGLGECKLRTEKTNIGWLKEVRGVQFSTISFFSP